MTVVHPEFIITLFIMVAIFSLFLLRRMPDVQGTIDLINVLNTKGGNILVLTVITLISFFAGLHFLYQMLDKIHDGKLSGNDALIGMGFQWISGGVTVGALSALFKTMSPEDMSTATKPSTSTTERTSTTTEKVTPPTESNNG